MKLFSCHVLGARVCWNSSVSDSQIITTFVWSLSHDATISNCFSKTYWLLIFFCDSYSQLQPISFRGTIWNWSVAFFLSFLCRLNRVVKVRIITWSAHFHLTVGAQMVIGWDWEMLRVVILFWYKDLFRLSRIYILFK